VQHPSLWQQLRSAISLLTHGNSYIFHTAWVTIEVALVATSCALVIGLPIGLALGLGRFRGRRTLQILANASLAVPPVVVGVIMLLLTIPRSALSGVDPAFTLRAVFVVQTILALPYVIALTPAAIQGLAPGLLDQARALGAGRLQLSLLALREAKIAMCAAVIAAMGATIAAVGAVIIVGGNHDGYDQTLASALIAQFNYYGDNSLSIGIAIALLIMILILGAALTALQLRTDGIRMRFRPT
jgi:tungstate transport system permease protein